MTDLIATNAEREDLGNGQYRTTIYSAPIAYDDAGTLRRIVSDFVDGDQDYPNIVTSAGFGVRIKDSGIIRYLPTRDPAVYFEIGDPTYVLSGVTRTFDFLNPTRDGNKLTWTKLSADMYYEHCGNFGKLSLWIKTAVRPDNREFMFPITYQGCERSGNQILVNGESVMQVRPFRAYDRANPGVETAVPHSFRDINGIEHFVVQLPIEVDSYTELILDPTLTLQPDETAGKDTYIQENAGASNYGISTRFRSGEAATTAVTMRGMLKFDITSLPASAVINSATLTLYCQAENDATNYSVGVHRALTEWYEGNKDGVVPAVDETGSVWNLRDYRTSTAWDGGVGGGSGSDFAAVATATTSITSTGASFDWDVLADVAAWYAGATNYGWWLINVGEGTANSLKDFTSSDGAVAANRPKLVVDYTVPVAGDGASWRGMQTHLCPFGY